MAKPAKPRPMPVYLVLRRLVDPVTGKDVAAFVPSSDADRSILRERDFKINTKIRADLKQPRNPKFNNLVHGLGRVLSQNIDRFSGKLSHDAIKLLQTESGVCCDEEVFDIPGLGQLTSKIPQSLSYDSMGEELFQDFWRQCCAYLVLHDWPTLTEERLTEMAEFESFKEAA
ncbi:hypothetical protein QN399_01020 [Pseudomonas sp. 10C3]|uniref:hypothetical protein n=1 Tax=Pseudomonas sp. 10C3 TaxID=3118753 RepID=UPI002E80A447|nr:hypothetical protein [Pseudomonas sp. 10C3]MEE3504857.1 hypothetical protein [Pseudomonas sp. 10C3]